MKLTLIILLTPVLFMSADKRDNCNRIRTTTESGSLKKEVSHRSIKKTTITQRHFNSGQNWTTGQR